MTIKSSDISHNLPTIFIKNNVGLFLFLCLSLEKIQSIYMHTFHLYKLSIQKSIIILA